MLKNLLFSLTVLLPGLLFAQVQIDKPIELTGAGTDAKVTGIKDVSQGSDAVSAEVLQGNQLVAGTATGTSNNFVLNPTPAIASLITGMTFVFKSNQTITGAASLNVNGLGVIPIKKTVNEDLEGCDILNGQMVEVSYDGTNFQMMSPINSDSQLLAPTALAATNVRQDSFTANWAAQTGANYYELDVSTQSNFSSFLPGFQALNVGNSTSYNVHGLSLATQYYYRVRAVNSCGASPSSNVVNQQTANNVTSMMWTDNTTGSCPGNINSTMAAIAAAMPNGNINVRIEAQQVSPQPNYGYWKSTFLNSPCVKQWLTVWGARNTSTYNNWAPAVCQATDTTGQAYYFVLKDAGGANPQVAIYPVGASPAQYMKIYLLDRTGPWCDLAGVNNRPSFDSQVTNSNTSGNSGDFLKFTWW